MFIFETAESHSTVSLTLLSLWLFCDIDTAKLYHLCDTKEASSFFHAA